MMVLIVDISVLSIVWFCDNKWMIKLSVYTRILHLFSRWLFTNERRELGSERRETVRSLSAVGVG